MVWGAGGVPKLLPKCWACGKCDAGVTHVLAECAATKGVREETTKLVGDEVAQWALTGCRNMEELRAKVVYVGRCVAMLVAAGVM